MKDKTKFFLEKVLKKLQRSLNKIEDLWVRKSLIICLILGLLFGVFHHFEIIINFRGLIVSAIGFASIIVAVTGLFLTLMINLKDNSVFARVEEYIPSFRRNLYISLRNQVGFSLSVAVLSLIGMVTPNLSNKTLVLLGSSIWFFLFWRMTLGAFYSVKLVTDVVVKNFEIAPRRARK